jgi:hypothetical protein
MTYVDDRMATIQEFVIRAYSGQRKSRNVSDSLVLKMNRLCQEFMDSRKVVFMAAYCSEKGSVFTLRFFFNPAESLEMFIDFSKDRFSGVSSCRSRVNIFETEFIRKDIL